MVSGGSSANFEWLRSTDHIGRINNLRLGESILLGCEPLHGSPIVGLHHDTSTVFGEVIESKFKPLQPWGDRARTPFVPVCAGDDHGSAWQSIVAIGHQDTDPGALRGPAGLRILGASSDHLVVGSDGRLAIGSEIAFRPGYSAFVRAMTAGLHATVG